MNCVRDYPVFTEIYHSCGVVPLRNLTAERDEICSIRENPVADEEGNYHGRLSEQGEAASIDHIVALPGGFAVEQYRVVTDQFALDVSDHCPVYADVRLIGEGE
jgi:endonuclease/exonuclease/phosphatase family metal-dependent hydrolase